MKAKRTQTFLALILLLLFVFPTVTACFGNGEPVDTAEPSTTEGVLLAHGEESDYILAVNTSNGVEYAFAKYLQSRIYQASGATVKIQNAGTAPADAKKILVGDTGADESKCVKETLQADDFALCLTEKGNLVLAVTDAAEWEGVRVILENEVFAKASDHILFVPKAFSFSYRKDCPDGKFGSSVTVPKDGTNDYVLIYGSDFSKSETKIIADYLKKTTGVTFAVKSDSSENPHEILLGKTARRPSSAAMTLVTGSHQYCISVWEDDLIINGTDPSAILEGVCRFAKGLSESKTGYTLRQSDNVITTYETPAYATDYAQSVALYQSIYPDAHSSYVDLWRSLLSESDREDQRLIEATVSYLGKGVAFRFDSSTALTDGKAVKLDPADYAKKAVYSGGKLSVPVCFVNSYFGVNLQGDQNGYWDLSNTAGLPAFTLMLNTQYQIGILMPGNDTAYQNADQTDGTYTNRQFWERIAEFYSDPLRREPNNPTEQTGKKVAEAIFDPSVVYDYTKTAFRTLYSPGICTVKENGKDVLYVSYESCLVTNFATESGNITYLVRSEDGGDTWEEMGKVPEMRWACIFPLNEKIYLLGTQSEGSKAMIGEYSIASRSFRWVNLNVVGGSGAPCSVLITDGRLYKADGDRIMSISVNDDLMQAKNWTFSENSVKDLISQSQYLTAVNGTSLTKDQVFAFGEANVVEHEGKIYMIARIDAGDNWGHVAIVEVSKDGKKLSLVPSCNSLVDLPTSTSKFSVRYDPDSELFLTMISTPTLPGGHAAKQRNILALYASPDLIHWTEVDVLLSDRELMNNVLSARAHGFQYVDFVVSGDDLQMVVREATGVTNSYHDGKYVRLYTVENFRQLIADRCPGLMKE